METLVDFSDKPDNSDDAKNLIDRAFSAASQAYGVPEPILRAIADVESGGNPNATGPQTKLGRARGLMQLMPATAKALGVNPANPVEAIVGAAYLLSNEYDYFKSKGETDAGAWEKAIKAYFAGRRAAERDANPSDPLGTRANDYVEKVASRALQLSQQIRPASSFSDQQGPTTEEVGRGLKQSIGEEAGGEEKPQIEQPTLSSDEHVVVRSANQQVGQSADQNRTQNQQTTASTPSHSSDLPRSVEGPINLTQPLVAEVPELNLSAPSSADQTGEEDEEIIRVVTHVGKTPTQTAGQPPTQTVFEPPTVGIADVGTKEGLGRASKAGKLGALVAITGPIIPGDNKQTILYALSRHFGVPESVVEQIWNQYFGNDFNLYAPDPATGKRKTFSNPESVREWYPFSPEGTVKFGIPIRLALDLAAENTKLWESGSTGLPELDLLREVTGWSKQDTLEAAGALAQFGLDIVRPFAIATADYFGPSRRVAQITNNDIAPFFDLANSADFEQPEALEDHTNPYYTTYKPVISTASSLVFVPMYSALGALAGPKGALVTGSLALSLSDAALDPMGRLVDANTGEPLTPAQVVGRTATNAAMFALAGGLSRVGSRAVTDLFGPAPQSFLGKVGRFVGNAAADALAGVAAGVTVTGATEAGAGILDNKPASEIARDVGRAVSGQLDPTALASQIGGAIGFQIFNRLVHGQPGKLVTPAFEDASTGQKFAIGVDGQGRATVQDLPASFEGPTVKLNPSDWLELKSTNFSDPDVSLRVIKAATAQGSKVAFAQYVQEAASRNVKVDPEFKAASLNPDIQALAEAYAKGVGLELPPVETYTPVDSAKEQVLGEAADYYAATPHTPNDAEMRGSYESFAHETIAQYKAIQDWVLAQTGKPLEVMAWTGESEPYANSRQMIDDVVRNGRYFYLPTDTAGTFAPDHPMLQKTGLEDSEGRSLVLNDVFRIVHDVFGHGQYSNQFGPNGELNAWRYHSRLYSPEAQKALANETIFQNAATNFNKEIRSLPPEKRPPLAERPFVDQKVIPIPDELLGKLRAETEKGGVAVLPVQYERNQILGRLNKNGYLDVGELSSRNEVLAAGRVAAELGLNISPFGRVELNKGASEVVGEPVRDVENPTTKPPDIQNAPEVKGTASVEAARTEQTEKSLVGDLEAAAVRAGKFRIRLNGGNKILLVSPYPADPLNYAVDEAGNVYSLDVHPPAISSYSDSVDHSHYTHIPALYKRAVQYGRVVDFGENRKVAVVSDDVFETIARNSNAVGASVPADALYSAPISPELKKMIVESAGPDGRVVLVRGSEPAESVFLQTIPHELVHSALSGVSERVVNEAINSVDESSLTDFGRGLLSNPRVALNEMLAYAASGEWGKIWTSREAAAQTISNLVSRIEAVEGKGAKQIVERIRSVSRHAEEFFRPREDSQNQAGTESLASDSADVGRDRGASERGSRGGSVEAATGVRAEPDSAQRGPAEPDQVTEESSESGPLFREVERQPSAGASLEILTKPNGEIGKLHLFPEKIRKTFEGLTEPTYYGDLNVYVPEWYARGETDVPVGVSLEGEGQATITELPVDKRLYEKLKKELTGTYFTADESGTPLVFYHGTIKSFDRFLLDKTSDFGFHAGTKKAAVDRIEFKLREGGQDWNTGWSAYIPLVIKAENPLISMDDLGGKQSIFIDSILSRPHIFQNLNPELIKEIQDEILGRGFNSAYDREVAESNGVVPRLDFREVLRKYGYDSVLYLNRVEDPGSYSVIFLDSEQVKHAYNATRYDFSNANIYYRERTQPKEAQTPAKVVMGGPTHFIVEETIEGADAYIPKSATSRVKEITLDSEPRNELDLLNAALRKLGAGAILTEEGKIDYLGLVRGIEALRNNLSDDNLRIKTPTKSYLFLPNRHVTAMVNPMVGAVVYDGGTSFGKGAIPAITESGAPVFVGSKFAKSALTSKPDNKIKAELDRLFSQEEQARYGLRVASGNAYSLKGAPTSAIGGIGRTSVPIKAIGEFPADVSKFQGLVKGSLAGRDTPLAVWGIGSTEFAHMPEATGKDRMPVVEVLLTSDGRLWPLSGGPNIAALTARRGAVPVRVFIEELSPTTKSMLGELENQTASSYITDPDAREAIRKAQLNENGLLNHPITLLPSEYYSLPVGRAEFPLPRVEVTQKGATLLLPDGYKPTGPIKAEVYYDPKLDLRSADIPDYFSFVGEVPTEPTTHLKDFVERGTFSLVSGYHNKSGKDFIDRLERSLNAAGFKTVRVRGRYAGTEENSLLVLHENIPNAEERIDIAALHAGQQATVHVRGGVATLRDFGRHVEVHKPIAEMVEYTTPESELVGGEIDSDGTFLPDGRGFIFNFNFESGSTTIPLNKEFGRWIEERLSRGPFYPEREELSIINAVPGITTPPTNVVYEGRGSKEVADIEDVREIRSAPKREENFVVVIAGPDGSSLELPIGRVLSVGGEEMKLWAAPFKEVVWGVEKPTKQNQLALRINNRGELEGQIIEKKREGKKNETKLTELIQLGLTPDNRVLLADKKTGVPMFEVGVDGGELLDVWRLSQRPTISTVTRALADTATRAGLNPGFRRVPLMGTFEYNKAVDVLTHGFTNIALRGLSALNRANRLEDVLGVKAPSTDWLPSHGGEPPSAKFVGSLVDAMRWYIRDVKRAMPFIRRLADVADGDELMRATLNQVARLSLANTSAGEDVASNLRLAVEALRRAFGVGIDLEAEQEQFLRDLPLLMNGYVPKGERVAAEPNAHQIVIGDRVYIRSAPLTKEIADWGPIIGLHRWLSSRPQVGTTNSEAIYGKKVGQFGLSLFDNAFTAAADRWVARISRLLLGLHDLAIGDPDGSKMTDRERALYVRAINNTAKTLNLMLEERGLSAVFDAKTVQAFLWYFTKNVFGEFGVPQQYNSTYSRVAIEELFNKLSEKGQKLNTETRARLRREGEELASAFDDVFGDIAPLNFMPTDLPLYREKADAAQETVSDQYGDPVYWIGLVSRLRGGKIDHNTIAAIETMAAQGNVEGLKQLVRNQLPSVVDLLIGKLSRASKLSGIGTQIRNAVSNIINTTATTTSLYGAAILDNVYSRIFHTPPTLYALNPKEFVDAVVSAARELWPTVKRVWEGQADAAKFAFEAQMADAGELPDWLGWRGKATHYIDSIANAIFKVQSVADLPYRLFTYQVARRMIAKARALDLGVPESEALAWLNPADEEAALNIAALAVFQAETGTLARGFIHLTDELKTSPFLRPLLNLIVPFPKTPANIAQQTVDFSPLGLTASASKALTEAGRRVLATDQQARLDFLLGIAKGTLGTALWTLGYYLAKHGFLTTTLAWTDKDQEERRRQRYLGLQDGALVLDGATYKIDGIGPAGTALVAGATAFRSDSPVDFVDRMGALMLTMYPQGKAAKVVSEGRLSDQLVDLGLVPTILAEAARATDPYERDTRADEIWDKIKNRLKSQIPGLRTTLPPKLDDAGRPVEASPFNPYSPFKRAALPPDYSARKTLYEMTGATPSSPLPDEDAVLRAVLPFAEKSAPADLADLTFYARRLIRTYQKRTDLSEEDRSLLLHHNLRVMVMKKLARESLGVEREPTDEQTAKKLKAIESFLNRYFTSDPRKAAGFASDLDEIETALEEKKKQQSQ